MSPRVARPGSRLKLAPVHRNTFVSVLGSFVVQAMLLVTGVLVARSLGVEDRGHLALLFLVAIVLGQLGILGLPLAATFWIAKQPHLGRPIVRRLVRPAVMQAVVLLGIQALVLQLIVGGDGDNVRRAALFTLPLTPFAVAHQYALAIFQGQQRFRAFNIFRTLPSVVYAAGVLGIVLAGADDLPAVALVFTCALGIAACIGTGYAWAGLAPTSGDESEVPRLADMVRFGLKGQLGSISPLDTFQLDQAVVGLFISPAALGLYVVGLAFTNLPRFVAQSIGFVAFPHVAEHSDPAAARRAMWKFAALALAACGAIVVALEATTGWLLPAFFGHAFSPAVDLARILLISALLVGVRRVLADGARGAGHPGLGTVAEAAAWISLVPALAILAPAAGATGVAVALAISAGIGMGALLGALIRIGRRAPPPTTTTQPAAHLVEEVTP